MSFLQLWAVEKAGVVFMTVKVRLGYPSTNVEFLTLQRNSYYTTITRETL